EYPVTKWILKSESVDTLLQTARDTGDDVVWIQRVPFPTHFSRTGATYYNPQFYQLADLSVADFHNLQLEIQRSGGKPITNSPTADKYLADATKPLSANALGVML